MQENVSQKWYVYTLACPDGTVFYVGKGQRDRIDEHELDARAYRDGGTVKGDTIRQIWQQGGQVVKNKVAHFEDEQDAYMYEWALINMTTYTESLVNVRRGPTWPRAQRLLDFPPLNKPVCLQRSSSSSNRKKGKVHHQITDFVDFALKQGMSPYKTKELIDGEIRQYNSWKVIDCECL